MRLSVIIPTWNEVEQLGPLVKTLRLNHGLQAEPEILVADCASDDGTADFAEELGVQVSRGMASQRSRSEAIRRGLALATGEVFLFCDADSCPPSGYGLLIASAFDDPEVVGGAFDLRFDSQIPAMRRIERLNRFRYRWTKVFYGDQGVFTHRQALDQIGGFPPQALMETAALCKKLRRIGKLVVAGGTMTTSSRRFLANGPTRVFAGDVLLWILDWCRVPVEGFAQRYWRASRQPRRRG